MTSESDILGVAVNGVPPVFVGGVLFWLIKTGFAQLRKTMEEFGLRLTSVERQQTECRLSLMREFRLKAEAVQDSERQWCKLDELGQRLTRVETLIEDDGK